MALTPAAKAEVIGIDFAANGHLFNEDMVCNHCKKTWEEHQIMPHPCFRALENLEKKADQLARKFDKAMVKIQDELRELIDVANYKPGDEDDTAEGQEEV